MSAPIPRVMKHPQPHRAWCIVLLTVLAVVFASAAFASSAVAAFPGENGRIAVGLFGTCIRTMNPDGTDERSLVGCGIGARPGALPEWSPDGRRLLFLRGLGHPALMSADGSHRRLIPLSGRPPFSGEFKPSFSPDGHQFLFMRYRPSYALGAQLKIWRATTDGRQERPLRAGWLPRWSPDGTTIAYVDPQQYVTGDVLARRTWLMDAKTGKRLRRIGPEAGSLDWSPDGRSLVYSPSVCCSEIDTDLFVVSANGQRSRRRLTQTRGWSEVEAVWSPNGRRIAFVRMRTIDDGGEVAKYQVLTMNRTGKDRRLIWESDDVITEIIASGIALSWGPAPR